MIKFKSPKQIEALRKSGQLVMDVFEQIKLHIQPGITLAELDQISESEMKKLGAETLYKGYRQLKNQVPFPGVITASVNDQVCHGIPTRRKLVEGDIVGIDIGLRYKGWCGDACITFPVGDVSKEAQDLMEITRTCLKKGIQVAEAGRHVGDIGAAIKAHADKKGYFVVREFGGHGVGQDLHEAPFVSHIGPAGQGVLLKEGMVITIEPMINTGTDAVRMLPDQWTAVTTDGSLSAQFEHMIAITKNGPDVLSLRPGLSDL